MGGRGQEIHFYDTFGYHIGYGYPKLPAYPPLISRTPLSPFNKFDTSQIYLQLPTSEQISQISGEDKKLRSGFAGFSPFCSSISSPASGSHQTPSISWLHPISQDQPIYYYFFPDEHCHRGGIFKSGIINFERETNHQEPFIDVIRDPKAGKRGKISTPTTIVKGKWTEEEDRLLKETVSHFDIRKWAQITENLCGRTGKQCREHWQNYLRPNIKKDKWDEEEERLLVNAHQLLGNKWVEIAKKIPKRTENSIKNHWNATKRRQIKKRKSMKMNKKMKSTILQDYIESKVLHRAPINPAVFEDLTMPINNMMLDTSDIEASTLLGDPCAEEILFMQNLFKDCNTNFIVPQALSYDDQVSFDMPYDKPTQANNQGGFLSLVENQIYTVDKDCITDLMDDDHSQLTQANNQESVFSSLGTIDPFANHIVSAPFSLDLDMSDLVEGTNFVSSKSSSTSINGCQNFNDESEDEQIEIKNPRVRPTSEDMGLLAMVYPFTLYARDNEASFNK